LMSSSGPDHRLCRRVEVRDVDAPQPVVAEHPRDRPASKPITAPMPPFFACDISSPASPAAAR
jgi:hypothetical protein